MSNETPYIQIQILPEPRKCYTIPDGVDGDILQGWSHTIISLPQQWLHKTKVSAETGLSDTLLGPGETL